MTDMSRGDGGGCAFGRLLQEHRRRQLLSQEELAERAGVSVRSIGYLESSGVRRPRAGSVRCLADALGLHGVERTRFEYASQGEDEPAPVPAHGPGAGSGPAQLPGDVSGYVGRERELEALDRMLEQPSEQPSDQAPGQSPGGGPGEGLGSEAGARATALIISAVSGTAGVGKTALVVRWAHARLDRFPHGQLFIDLRGYSPHEALSPNEALARLLRALGVAPAAVPFDPEERSALLRTRIAGRRMLLVLDNAADVEQVRPLLPGTPGCFTVVTSRSSLGALVARHGARRLDLDLLSPKQARDLLAGLIGARAQLEPEALGVLAEQCARLPLALRVAAELAASRPGSTLSELAAELADEDRRLRLLDAGDDPQTAVQAVLSWSYRRLAAGTARVFRLIGLHPGPDLDARAVAALAGTDVEVAAAALAQLERAHLLTQVRAGRYWMHDLLHAYAGLLARARPPLDAGTDSGGQAFDQAGEQAADQGGDDPQAALGRLFDYYLGTAALAVGAISPTGTGPAPVPATGAYAPVVTFADAATALAWLDDERPVLADPQLPAPAAVRVELSQVLWAYLYEGCHTVEALAVHQRALAAARASADATGTAAALRGLATVYWRWGQLPTAAEHAGQAVQAARAAGATVIEAHALAHLGGINGQQSHYTEAEQHYAHALALYRRTGVRHGQAATLLNLGVIQERRGQLQQAVQYYQEADLIAEEIGYLIGRARARANLAEIARQRGQVEAVGYYEQAVALFEACRHPVLQAQALEGLGSSYRHHGRIGEAIEAHQRALELFRRNGNRVGEGWALDSLGADLLTQQRSEQALATFERALALFDETGDQTGQISSTTGLGDTLAALGRPNEALQRYAQAKQWAWATGDRSEEARALAGLAAAARQLGDLTGASRHAERARDLYSELGLNADVARMDAEVEHLLGARPE